VGDLREAAARLPDRLPDRHRLPVPETDVGGSLYRSNARITGGGVHVAMPRPLVTLGASFSDSGDQWVSEAVNLDTTTAATVTIVAICAA
jgi:hypothetical protein